MREIYDAHGKWWVARRKGESPDLPAMGLFKALRNFVHPLLKARQEPQIGVDYNPQVAEALGDMLMYLFSIQRASGVTIAAYYTAPMRTAEGAIAALATAFSRQLMAITTNQLRGEHIVTAVAMVVGTCDMCAISWKDAANISLKKLESK